MLQFSKVLASLCAGCLCTLTIHQIPALGNVLLPQTHAIPETSPIRPVDVMPLEPLPTPAETAPAMSIPPTETQSPQTQTWFKAYMDYCTITDTDSVQYAMEQNAWTDDRGLRRMADDYLVAMGTGWLESGCGERFAVTLENGSEFTVRVGDIKADQHTDKTHRYRSCESGANVLEFIVDTGMLSGEARNAGTVSVYPELSGNITAIVPAE